MWQFNFSIGAPGFSTWQCMTKLFSETQIARLQISCVTTCCLQAEKSRESSLKSLFTCSHLVTTFASAASQATISYVLQTLLSYHLQDDRRWTNQEVWIGAGKTFLCDTVLWFCACLAPPAPSWTIFFFGKICSTWNQIWWSDWVTRPLLQAPIVVQPSQDHANRAKSTYMLPIIFRPEAHITWKHAPKSLRKHHLLKSHDWHKMFGQFFVQAWEKIQTVDLTTSMFLLATSWKSSRNFIKASEPQNMKSQHQKMKSQHNVFTEKNNFDPEK